jgi:hypothetical protein
MALCHDDRTPCPIGAKKVGLMGAIFTSSKHLLAPLWHKSIIHMRTMLVAAFAAVAKMSV